jgi:hypothetical protein
MPWWRNDLKTRLTTSVLASRIGGVLHASEGDQSPQDGEGKRFGWVRQRAPAFGGKLHEKKTERAEERH